MTAPIDHHLSTQDYIALEKKWGANNYNPIPVVLARGKGVWLWDVDGKKYLDMMSAYSAVSHGHGHPRILEVLREQSESLSLCSRAYHTDKLPLFLEKLCKTVHMDKALPMNSGAEAVETAIKAVRRWGYKVKGIKPNKAEIIVTSHNFHGRTVGIISFSSEPSYKEGFGPFLPGFVLVPFGDADALKAAITPNTCAVITEPIQGEAGIILPPAKWLKKIETICRENNILLVVDEIQSGLGRTGKILACEHDNVHPDGVILGKALGGGVFPVSALAGKSHLMDVFTPASHGSTFGGNPLAAAIGLRALEIIEEEKFCQRSHEMGDYLMKKLQKINCKAIRDIRGKGLWIGIDLNPKILTARKACEKLAKIGILSKETHDTVIRIAPPLVISEDELNWGITGLKQVLKN